MRGWRRQGSVVDRLTIANDNAKLIQIDGAELAGKRDAAARSLLLPKTTDLMVACIVDPNTSAGRNGQPLKLREIRVLAIVLRTNRCRGT